MVKAIVGANWGDEGKGKITDMLAEQSDVVIRFQGGANAGHTIINDYGRFALHILPSGAFYPHITNIIGNGVALDAAKLVAESGRSDVASISSPECANLYGLSVLTSEIANSDSNFTRFICIAKDLAIYPGANRISLMVSAQHTPGALYTLISKFSVLGLNLTKLESRPIEGLDFEFMFYFDIEADVCAAPVLGLLGDLDRAPETFNFLGAYSEL